MKIKNGQDVTIDKVTPENYVVPHGEEHLYHVKQQIPQFDQKTGAPMTKPFIQKYGKKSFESFIADELKLQGYTVVILHDPNDFIEATEAEKRAKAEANAAAMAEAEAARKAAEKEALKAEIMAELAQSGIVVTNDTAPGETEEMPKGKKAKE